MWFENLSLKRKIVGVIVLTSLLVLLMTSLALLSYELHSYRRTTTQHLSTLAEIIAANSSTLLMFDDPELAREILAGLRAEPDISAAAYFDKEGKLYATYPANQPTASFPRSPGADGINFQTTSLTLYQPIFDQEQKRVGTLYLEDDLRGMYRRLGVYSLVLLTVLAGSGLAALFLSTIFQRRISQPMLELAKTAKIVSERKDYSVRATKTSNDELGFLTDAFNSMLDQIQTSHSALRESEERFRTMADNIAQFAWMADEKGWVFWYNRRWFEYTGTTLEEMEGWGWRKVHHPDYVDQVVKKITRCFHTGEVWEDIFPLRRHDGHYRWFLSRAVPIRNARGKVQRWFGTNTDISEQKQVEQELEQARDEALAASRAKDDFLAALSHELRNPLNPALLVASDAVNNPEFPPDVKAAFDSILKNVELEARLIDDLLDLTRITRGKLSLEMKPLDLHAILRDAIGAVNTDLQKKRIVLKLDLSAPKYQVLGDPIRLRQVFWNVLNNAAKFTPESGEISVETHWLKASGQCAVRIADTGIGMTSEERERIFEVFSQGDHAESGGSHRFGGLGLGLAISRMLVECHHGRIRAESAGRDQGTTISIELPVLRLAERTGDSKTAEPLPRPLPQSIPKTATELRKNILLVEDHEATRTALELLLSRRSYQVTTAASLGEARALLKKRNFDLVISDIGLPDGSGFDLMAEFRECRGLKGIALTGYGMEQDIKRSQEAGFVAHLTKPVRVEALESALASAINSDSIPPE